MGADGKAKNDALVFAALGGIGEIGMNLYLYGLGPEKARQWLMVDLGVTFPDDHEPGVDVIMPDIEFIEARRDKLLGIVLTHAHEDHFGAVADLWPYLRVPVYATPFTCALLKAKFAEYGVEEGLELNEVQLGSTLSIGPFTVDLVNMAHSIPEPNALVIRTPHGTVFHSGDWKLDPTPLTSPPSRPEVFEKIGASGVRALVCDSTNAMREGISPSEADVAATLKDLIAKAPNRVAVTTFASNVARMRSVLEAARATGRDTVVVGRAMHRVIGAAQETGYLTDEHRYLTEDDFGHLPRDKVVLLCTGSQGEPRAALSRIAGDTHPRISLARDDMVIFSSRTIPGNEKVVSRVQNMLADRGVTVLTDADGLVHVSGHPRRGELAELYGWLKPEVAVAMHGEPRHLLAHAKFARDQGVREVIEARNGTLVQLAPGPAKIVGEVPVGRVYRDGRLLVHADADMVRERRKLAVAGVVSVAVTLTKAGDMPAAPDIAVQGLPPGDDDDDEFLDAISKAVRGVVASMPRPRRKDVETVREAVRRGVRAAVGDIWGKKPVVMVLVTQL